MEIGLTIQSEITTNQGMAVTNAYLTSTFNTSTVLSSGNVVAVLSFYKSQADKDAGVEPFVPVINGLIVAIDNFIILPTDVIKQSGKTTFADVAVFFYAKLKDSLQTKYGWTII